MKAETSLRKPEVRRVPVVQGIMPGKQNVQLNTEKQEIDLSSKKLQENKSAIKSSSPQKENVDSPEKLKHEVSSSPRPGKVKPGLYDFNCEKLIYSILFSSPYPKGSCEVFCHFAFVVYEHLIFPSILYKPLAQLEPYNVFSFTKRHYSLHEAILRI